MIEVKDGKARRLIDRLDIRSLRHGHHGSPAVLRDVFGFGLPRVRVAS